MNKVNIIIGFLLLILDWIYSYLETKYFDFPGHGFLAESNTEWAFDIFGLIVLIIGMTLIFKGIRKNKTKIQ
jgi:hypothetical protein